MGGSSPTPPQTPQPRILRKSPSTVSHKAGAEQPGPGRGEGAGRPGMEALVGAAPAGGQVAPAPPGPQLQERASPPAPRQRPNPNQIQLAERRPLP